MTLRHAFALMLIALATTPSVFAQGGDPAIVPRPKSMKVGGPGYTFGKTAIVHAPKELESTALWVAETLITECEGLTATSIVSAPAADLRIDVWLTADGGQELGAEGYTLKADPKGVVIRGGGPAGVFHGAETLRQLVTRDEADPAKPWTVPGVEITDKPRYPWRGMLLDCCRHFMSKEKVKSTIDLLAFHKMNVLHWHLTEDQGWRIEIKRYPKLTEIGAWRDATNGVPGRHGGFYTQDDIREIVAYAAARAITIVPEIEMPGHALAALACYPELSCTGGPFKVQTDWGVIEDVYCAGNDRTFEFIEGVLTEVLALFPSKYLHIGGDECPKNRWKACPKCQARIQAEHLKDEHELQSWFVRRVEKFLNSKGRRLIGWDEILEGGIAPNATIQSWRGMAGAIAAGKAGHDVIASPTSHCYLDFPEAPRTGGASWMDVTTLEKTYSFEPTPKELEPEQQGHILGAEGNVWTERIPEERLEWMAYPRIIALAELTWSPLELRDWKDFQRRMAVHYRRLDALGVKYFIPPPRLVSGELGFEAKTTVKLACDMPDTVVRFTRDGSLPGPTSEIFPAAIELTSNATFTVRSFRGNGRGSDPLEIAFAVRRPHKPIEAPDAKPGLHYELFAGTFEALPDFSTQTAVKSGYIGIPEIPTDHPAEHFAIRLDGLIKVAADGLYTFTLASDDGSRLRIGDEVVVDHDGPHTRTDRTGTVLLLAGLHPITVDYFQGTGAAALQLRVMAPGGKSEKAEAGMFWHRMPTKR